MLGRRSVCEQPRLLRLELVDVAAVVIEHRKHRLDVADVRELQAKVDAVVFALYAQLVDFLR